MANSERSDLEQSKRVNPSTGTEGSPVAPPETGSEENLEKSVRKKLIDLYTLQTIDSQIDKIRIIRGELPLEVQDLEDEIAGLFTRLEKFRQEIKDLEARAASATQDADFGERLRFDRIVDRNRLLVDLLLEGSR